MPRDKSRDEITFDGLREYLRSLGFRRLESMERAIALYHDEAGALLVLSIPQDGRTVRPADRTSVLTRLEYFGLVDEQALNEFRSGRLPIPS
jgi:hypothetical protein